MKHFFFLLLPFLASPATGQSQDWLVTAGGSHSDCGMAITSDASNHSYLTGSFQGQAAFGDRLLTSKGDTDIFLAKHNNQGDLIWIIQMGGYSVRKNTISEYPTQLAITEDALFITGVFYGLAYFGEQQVLSAGKEDAFLAKYDLEGQLLWVQRMGGQSQDLITDLVVDTDGNSYLTGYFQKEADFGHLQKTALNQREFFIAKYSPDGEALWVRTAQSERMSQGKALAFSDDQLVVAGSFQAKLDLGNQSIESNGPSDVFVASFSPDGTFHDLSSFGSQGLDEVNDIQLQHESLYLTGSFISNEADGIWQTKGGRDSYVIKLNGIENIAWMKNLGGTENDEGISLDSDGTNLLVAGKFSADFSFGDETYLSNGFTDIYLAKMDPEGLLKDVKVIGGEGQDYPTGIHYQSGTNQILMTGLFRNQLSTNTASVGASDIFLTSINGDLSHEDENKVIYLVYPNPTEDFFWVQSDEPIETIELINKEGVILHVEEHVGAHQFRLNIGELPSGMYFVRINETTIKKLLIM